MRTGPLAAACACLLAACRAEPPAAPPAAPPAGASGVTATSAEATIPAAAAGTTAATGPAATAAAMAEATSGAPAGTTTTPERPAPAARLPAPVEAPTVPVQEAVALVPGATTALTPGTQTTVDPAATFRVVLQGAFPDARLSILDPGDAMLAAGGAREVGATTALTLQPAAPLRPGTAYRLRVDGATTRELRAADGTPRAPVELPLLAAGDPPEEPRRKPAKKPRR